MKRLTLVIVIALCFGGGILGAKFHPRQMWENAVARAAASRLQGLPFVLGLGQPGETNQFTVQIFGNAVRIDALTNTTGFYRVATNSNIWMRDTE